MKQLVGVGTLIMAALASVQASSAQAFTNDIALPSCLYMLKGVRNEMFVQPFLKRWRPYDDFVRFDAREPGVFLRRLSSVATVTNPVDGARLDVSLVNGDEFETLKTLSPVMRAAEPFKGKKDVYAQIVGDSFTHGCFFRDALVDTNYVPNLHMVGLRRVFTRSGPAQYHEGRGGWRLDSYFKVPKGEQCSYHGFMHPENGRYWGDTAFWKMAWRCVRKTQPGGFQPTYSCETFGDAAVKFDESTGFLIAPKPGDCQYDAARRTMVQWDGSAWKAVDEKSLKFGFDYSKYLSMWGLHAPDFLFVYLGFNDFAAKGLKSDYAEWAGMIEKFKASYLAAVPKGRFALCIPLSTAGTLDNRAGDFSCLKNAAMWRFREWLIRRYDNREAEGWHLLDGGLAVDNEHGFYVANDDDPQALPFEKPAKRNGDQSRFKVQWGNPHPYPNYPAMGVPFAAFIQYWRDR